MGAWIEITARYQEAVAALIALCMGAWIEISTRNCKLATTSSHSVWVRGLKSYRTLPRSLDRYRTLYGCVD